MQATPSPQPRPHAAIAAVFVGALLGCVIAATAGSTLLQHARDAAIADQTAAAPIAQK